VNLQVKARLEDTRTRIMDVADGLFRQLGFAKTTVADIAGQLQMSPANVYRFFPSKEAIVQSICRRCLSQLEEKVWTIGRSRGPAADRIEQVVLEVVRYHKENLMAEKRVHDIVLVAIESNWDAIETHKDVIRNICELILRDGIASGEFEAVDPAETSRLMMRAFVAFMHPLLLAHCVQQEFENDAEIEAEARKTVRFVLKAITPHKART
jgi:AcrR family transcriptional regulator